MTGYWWDQWSSALIYGVAIIIVAGLVWIQAYNEARTYERLTGKHVTTWDAMWVDLRVQEQVKE